MREKSPQPYKRQILPPALRSPLFLATLAATIVKLAIALRAEATWDITAFQDLLTKVSQFGAGAYQINGPFGNPPNIVPFALNLARVATDLTDLTGISFAFWMRVPNIFADAGTIWLVSLLARGEKLVSDSRSLLLLALCPISILVSGFHGNVDPLMIFFVVLTVYLINTEKPAWVAALAFGMSLNIKVAPLIFAPLFYFELKNWRQRTIFFGASATMFFTGSLPYILDQPLQILRQVFGYGSLYGYWGWTIFTAWLFSQPVGDRFHPAGIHGVLATGAKFLLLVLLLVISYWFTRKQNRPSLFLRAGFIAYLFIFLTPGFGDQYLSWLVPWVIVLGLGTTFVFYLTAGLYLLFTYSCVVGIIGCEAHLPLKLLCWLVTGYVLWQFMTRLRNVEMEPASSQASPLS